MKITFLGTSHGAPEKNRKCTSTLIETDNSRYLIDIGTNPIEYFANNGIAVNSVKAVFITHNHGDHTHGLMSYVDLCGWYYKKSNPKIFIPDNVESVKNAVSEWLGLNGSKLDDRIEFYAVNEGVVFDDGTIRVTAFKTMHCKNSFSYLVQGEGKRILFTGDLSSKPETDFPMSAFDGALDLCVCESAHFEFTKLLPIFQGRDVKKLYFNHLYPPRLKSYDDFSKEIPSVIATDNMQIEI